MGRHSVLGPKLTDKTKWGQIMNLPNFTFGQFFM